MTSFLSTKSCEELDVNIVTPLAWEVEPVESSSPKRGVTVGHWEKCLKTQDQRNSLRADTG